jgi:hypothetical protein
VLRKTDNRYFHLLSIAVGRVYNRSRLPLHQGCVFLRTATSVFLISCATKGRLRSDITYRVSRKKEFWNREIIGFAGLSETLLQGKICCMLRSRAVLYERGIKNYVYVSRETLHGSRPAGFTTQKIFKPRLHGEKIIGNLQWWGGGCVSRQLLKEPVGSICMRG